MNGDERFRQTVDKVPAEFAIGVREEDSFSNINDSQSEFFNGSGELPRGVIIIFYNFARPAYQMSHTASAEVSFENVVRIIQLADDQIEAAEIARQFCR